MYFLKSIFKLHGSCLPPKPYSIESMVIHQNYSWKGERWKTNFKPTTGCIRNGGDVEDEQVE